jgi:hypothetical protein
MEKFRRPAADGVGEPGWLAKPISLPAPFPRAVVEIRIELPRRGRGGLVANSVEELVRLCRC